MGDELSSVPSSWICDSCGTRILSAGDGWLEWINDPDDGFRPKKFRIVHHASASPLLDGDRRCYTHYKKHGVGDHHLDAFTFMQPGPNPRFLDDPLTGLEVLLSFALEASDPREVHEVICRLFVPGYEENYRAARTERIEEALASRSLADVVAARYESKRK